jgi:hypothetical protein
MKKKTCNLNCIRIRISCLRSNTATECEKVRFLQFTFLCSPACTMTRDDHNTDYVRSKVHLNKLTVDKPVNKLSTFHAIRTLIIVFIIVRYWSLSSVSLIQLIFSQDFFTINFNIIHICLCLPNSIFPSGISTQICASLSASIYATCPAHLAFLYL